MKNFLLAVLAFVVLVIAIIASPLLFSSVEKPTVLPAGGLPWQIDLLQKGGSKVFGLTLGESPLKDAIARLGNHGQIAIVTAPGEPGTLEAYWESISVGFVMGKIILTLDAPGEIIEQMRQRAKKIEYMESATRKATLHPDDQQTALGRTIVAIALIPSAHLDEQMIIQRFGPPAERIRGTEHTEHFLYPSKGLDIRLDAKGKEVLQYVAPRDFARLRDPLLAHHAKRADAPK